MQLHTYSFNNNDISLITYALRLLAKEASFANTQKDATELINYIERQQQDSRIIFSEQHPYKRYSDVEYVQCSNGLATVGSLVRYINNSVYDPNTTRWEEVLTIHLGWIGTASGRGEAIYWEVKTS